MELASDGGADALVVQVREGGLLAPGRPVVVMVSGGRDSTCLLDVATRVTGRSAVTALHVNYGLRPESDEDERHCHALCGRLGVAFEVRRPARRGAGNLQAWAREARYAAAGQLADSAGADVAAGHTASDQVETILYRLASSPSRRAVLGMSPRSGRLVRPLLGFTREETAAYCTARGLGWREDETNEGLEFARGRVRHRLLPALREVHPAAEANLLAVAGLLRDEAELLDSLVDGVLAGRSEVELARLAELPPALARLVVQRLADGAKGAPAAGVARRTRELLTLSAGGRLDVGAGLRAVCRRGVLRFEPLASGGSARRSSARRAD